MGKQDPHQECRRPQIANCEKCGPPANLALRKIYPFSLTITEFDEVLVKRLITKITVFEDHFTIDFKSEVTIDIEA